MLDNIFCIFGCSIRSTLCLHSVDKVGISDIIFKMLVCSDADGVMDIPTRQDLNASVWLMLHLTLHMCSSSERTSQVFSSTRVQVYDPVEVPLFFFFSLVLVSPDNLKSTFCVS